MSAKIEAILQGSDKISMNSIMTDLRICLNNNILSLQLSSQWECPSNSFDLCLEREGGFRFLRASENQTPSPVSSHQG